MEERLFRVFSAYSAENTLKSLSSTVMIRRYFDPCLHTEKDTQSTPPRLYYGLMFVSMRGKIIHRTHWVNNCRVRNNSRSSLWRKGISEYFQPIRRKILWKVSPPWTAVISNPELASKTYDEATRFNHWVLPVEKCFKHSSAGDIQWFSLYKWYKTFISIPIGVTSNSNCSSSLLPHCFELHLQYSSHFLEASTHWHLEFGSVRHVLLIVYLPQPHPLAERCEISSKIIKF